ncbi:hypothetical protein [Ligilactobacillus pobuzihii]|nr:hypothetical protein [Ligilactobacillus pobuzihii]GEN48637.1 hypothetical protein LPO01_14290 [Ligilactobacillus pobuzihii]
MGVIFNFLSNIITLLIFVGVVYFIVKRIVSPKYRIVLTDPVTGYRKYLKSIDGINHSYTYSASAEDALVFRDGDRAERFASSVNREAFPEVQMKRIIVWHLVNKG